MVGELTGAMVRQAMDDLWNKAPARAWPLWADPLSDETVANLVAGGTEVLIHPRKAERVRAILAARRG